MDCQIIDLNINNEKQNLVLNGIFDSVVLYTGYLVMVYLS